MDPSVSRGASAHPHRAWDMYSIGWTCAKDHLTNGFAAQSQDNGTGDPKGLVLAQGISATPRCKDRTRFKQVLRGGRFRLVTARSAASLSPSGSRVENHLLSELGEGEAF